MVPAMPERVVLDEELRRERRADALRGTDSGSDDRLFMAMGIYAAR